VIDVELRQLRYFCAVAEEMHVTRAAERLHLAQPALTQQIKALETELQAPLLRRVGRGIELTQVGAAFWEEAKAILNRVRAATLIAQEAARGLAGRLAIGLTEATFCAPSATAVLKHARELWPGVEFRLSQGRTDELIAALTDRRIDLAFVRAPIPEDAPLESRQFVVESLHVALPHSHRLASCRSIELAALAGEDLILPRGRAAPSQLRSDILAGFKDSAVQPRIVQETPGFLMAINLVAAGFGITIVPAGLTSQRADGVSYRPLRSTPPLRSAILVVTRQGETSPVATNFLALAVEDASAAAQSRRRR
jgi:DNA-binding transcriptional LysR family regulator